MARFRYSLELGRLAALACEHAAGRTHLLAREALGRSRSAYAQLEGTSPSLRAGPAGAFAACACAAERVRDACAAETARLRARSDEAREALAAATLRRLCFDAHREVGRVARARAALRAEARENFEHSGFGRGASATPFESART